MSVLVTIAILAAAGLWLVGSYGRIAGLRNRVTRTWRQAAAAFSGRHDLVRRLLSAATAAGVEPGLLEPVAEARSHAAAARGPAEAARRESVLSTALAPLLNLIDRDSRLNVDPDMRALRDELAAADRTIGAARQSYNDLAMNYNAAIDAVPMNIVAGLAGFKRAEPCTTAG